MDINVDIQCFFIDLNNFYANHAHSDLVEFIGEFGLIGFTFLFISLLGFILNIDNYSFLNFILAIYLVVLLFFDFSLHIPIVQFLFIVFFNLNKKKT